MNVTRILEKFLALITLNGNVSTYLYGSVKSTDVVLQWVYSELLGVT